MTRIQVSDEMWTTYRALVGPTPVSAALGKLVEREVAAYRRRTALDADGIREAVDDARTVADELAVLIARLERPTGRHVRRASSNTTDGRLFE